MFFKIKVIFVTTHVKGITFPKETEPIKFSNY